MDHLNNLETQWLGSQYPNDRNLCLACLQAVFPSYTALSPLFCAMTVLASNDTQALSENYSITGYSSSSLFSWKTWAGKVKEGLCINVPFHLFSASEHGFWILSCDGFDHPVFH